MNANWEVFFCLMYSHKSFPEAICTSPNNLREEIKRLKVMEMQLKDAIEELSHHRDSLIMELQQLQEAKPVLEKAYAVSCCFFFCGV